MIGADKWAGYGPATVLRADALALPIAAASIDLIVTSPPYFALRSYQDGGEHYAGQLGSEATPDEFVSTLLAATREMLRVLKPSGSLWVNLGDKYANAAPSGTAGYQGASAGGRWGDVSHTLPPLRTNGGAIRTKSLIGIPWRYALRCIDELGLILRAEVVWSKPNGLPESATDRVRRSHEQWFHFVKSPRYFAAVDEIREPQSGSHDQGTRTNPTRTSGHGVKHRTFYGENENYNPLGKLPGSVREVPSAPLKVPADLGVDHFAAFPPAWPAWIIRGWSPAGVCVECGEGRRPVATETSRVPWGGQQNKVYGAGKHGQSSTTLRTTATHTITGYACACPTPDAPTRPAVVLDPFGGTGTTAMAARALGRHGISVDLSSDYCRVAQWRVQARDELATVRGIPRQGKPDDAQASLLDMLDTEAAS